MSRTITALAVFAVLLFPLGASAQSLDGSPYTPGKDPNIDLYLCGWQQSPKVTVRGALVRQDILTRGSHLDPPKKGAVLEHINYLAHGMLLAGAATQQTTLTGEQEVYYILDGSGTMQAGRQKVALYPNIAVIVPAGLAFTITAGPDAPLGMYIVSEPTPDGFKPGRSLVVRDENTSPITSTQGHWCHIVRNLFTGTDGLATISGIITVQVDPMTIPHPHSHGGTLEEIWTSIQGTSVAFIGKQIRWQPEGWGYMIPPNGNTPHSNINTGDEAVKFLYISSN